MKNADKHVQIVNTDVLCTERDSYIIRLTTLRLVQTIEHYCRRVVQHSFRKISNSCWTGGKTLSNIVEWAVQHILQMSYLAGDSK